MIDLIYQHLYLYHLIKAAIQYHVLITRIHLQVDFK